MRCKMTKDQRDKLARALGLTTLETRGSDSLDFSDQAVWTLRAALEKAYNMGRESAMRDGRTK